MKKSLICLMAALLLTGMAGVASAALDRTEIPASQAGRDFDAATPISVGVYYHVGENGKSEHNWFQFVAPQTGMYTVYVQQLLSTWANYPVNVYSKYREALAEEINIPYTPGADGVLSVDLEAGETYYLLIGVAHVNMRVRDNFQFAICSPTQHAGLGAPRTIRDAGCETEGYTARICELCGGEAERTTIPARGHQPGEMRVSVEATCKQSGLRTVECTVCSAVLDQQTIPMGDHTPGNMTTVLDANCTQEGRREQHCAVCDALLSQETIAATGHRTGVWEDLRGATCTADGQRAQRCAVCGETLSTETVPAFGHSIGEWVEQRAACTSEGARTRSCTVCGALLEHEAIPATGHEYTEWETVRAATRSEEGEQTRHCIHCGDTQMRAIEKLGFFDGILGG